jgi:TPP-dependent pyruvate/acetoin dehydrogenase alpha subunit
MHLIDVGAGIMGTSAIVATPIPQAMGYAYALKCRGEKRAVVCFFGEAATEEGAFHESMNFAVLKQLPVLFVCENNFFSIQSPVADRQGGRDIRQWVEGYGLPAVCVEGNDILEIRRYADGALAAIRKAGGPAFLECKTYRWRGHVGPEEDWHLGYRTLEEAKYWIDNDQLKRLAGRIDREVRESLEKAVTDEVAEAFEFAEDSAFPADGELWEHVFHGQ